MLTLILALSLGVETLPDPPARETLPDPVRVKPVEVVYRIGSLPPTWTPPPPVVYPQAVYPANWQLLPVAPAYCPPGRQ